MKYKSISISTVLPIIPVLILFVGFIILHKIGEINGVNILKYASIKDFYMIGGRFSYSLCSVFIILYLFHFIIMYLIQRSDWFNRVTEMFEDKKYATKDLLIYFTPLLVLFIFSLLTHTGNDTVIFFHSLLTFYVVLPLYVITLKGQGFISDAYLQIVKVSSILLFFYIVSIQGFKMSIDSQESNEKYHSINFKYLGEDRVFVSSSIVFSGTDYIVTRVLTTSGNYKIEEFERTNISHYSETHKQDDDIN